MARVYTYEYKQPKAKTIAHAIAKQCKPLAQLYPPTSHEQQQALAAIGLPERGIGWVKVVGPGQISVTEGTWAVKIECWLGEGPWGGSTQAARIIVYKDRTYTIEATPKFPPAFKRYFERQT